MHSRTKYIEIRHHLLRGRVSKNNCNIEYIETEKQLADIFTEPLARVIFYEIRNELGILDESCIS